MGRSVHEGADNWADNVQNTACSRHEPIYAAAMASDQTTYTSVNEAVRAARCAQDREDDGYGVGVSFGSGDDSSWVQWCHTSRGDTAWTLDLVEACFPKTRHEVATALRQRGFEPDEEMQTEYETNIWRFAGPPKSWAAVDELNSWLVELLRAVGAEDGMPLTVYP